MQTVYEVLKSWMPKFDPQGPDVFVFTDKNMSFCGTCGYLTSSIWADDMKKLKAVSVEEGRHIIYAEEII